MRLLWAAVVLSFAFWLLVLGLGFADPVAGAEGRYRTYFDEANWWPRLVAISNAQQEAFAPKTVRDLLKENSAAPWGAHCCPSGP